MPKSRTYGLPGPLGGGPAGHGFLLAEAFADAGLRQNRFRFEPDHRVVETGRLGPLLEKAHRPLPQVEIGGLQGQFVIDVSGQIASPGPHLQPMPSRRRKASLGLGQNRRLAVEDFEPLATIPVRPVGVPAAPPEQVVILGIAVIEVEPHSLRPRGLHVGAENHIAPGRGAGYGRGLAAGFRIALQTALADVPPPLHRLPGAGPVRCEVVGETLPALDEHIVEKGSGLFSIQGGPPLGETIVLGPEHHLAIDEGLQAGSADLDRQAEPLARLVASLRLGQYGLGSAELAVGSGVSLHPEPLLLPRSPSGLGGGPPEEIVMVGVL
jgi:hypothetical protein